ncbi:uncharacterized protein PITG_19614 [Phytophthora infestans T30-4]|uniref:Uncharacterized protein n=1 Tax=Phytophthora infestans (strain T30-4) TaxID=403677 RepID=D0P0D6_PHYIT|nr:uncharacterized protein PITG_19614 [Phytophthora infestans T30-4]EEY70314.1 conserved hypothetical protein [Phytophthora infestans T30-4]|eukprot:XP_002996936.1 conserved hypothetical protein [Phytophthora infestans T30-4]
MGTKKQRGYPIKEKLAAVDLVERIGLTAAVEKLGHLHGTVHGWWVGRAKLRVYEGNKLDKTTKGQGLKESFPFTSALLTYMKDVRRDEEFLTTSGMIAFIQENCPDWIEAYAENKKSDRTADRYYL